MKLYYWNISFELWDTLEIPTKLRSTCASASQRNRLDLSIMKGYVSYYDFRHTRKLCCWVREVFGTIDLWSQYLTAARSHAHELVVLLDLFFYFEFLDRLAEHLFYTSLNNVPTALNIILSNNYCFKPKFGGI